MSKESIKEEVQTYLKSIVKSVKNIRMSETRREDVIHSVRMFGKHCQKGMTDCSRQCNHYQDNIDYKLDEVSTTREKREIMLNVQLYGKKCVELGILINKEDNEL